MLNIFLFFQKKFFYLFIFSKRPEKKSFHGEKTSGKAALAGCQSYWVVYNSPVLWGGKMTSRREDVFLGNRVKMPR